MIYLDFETRSACELKFHGTYQYARHPSTDVMCLCWTYDDEDEVHVWHPGFIDFAEVQQSKVADRTKNDLPATPFPDELAERVELGELMEAHNAFFERNIWMAIMVQKYGFPAVDDDQWRCSAAVAASFAMRRKLEHVAADLRVSQQKDMDGHKAMLALSKPRTATARERVIIAEANGLGRWKYGKTGRAKPKYIVSKDTHKLLSGRICDLPDKGIQIPETISPWNQSSRDILRLIEYCKQDVRTERAVAKALRPLTGSELDLWKLDQKINMRGVFIDVPFAQGALRAGAEAEKMAEAELQALTDGEVEKTTKRQQFKEWLRSQGVKIPTKLAKHIDDETGEMSMVEKETTESKSLKPLLKDADLPEHVAQAIETWLAINKTSTKKYKAMMNRVSLDDHRVREILRYYAATTGRWGGMGIQPQNFPRKCPKPEEMVKLCADVTGLDYELLCMLHGDDMIMPLLSSLLRGAICAAPGKDLIAADFSAVEARGTFWIAGQEDGLETFRKIDRGDFPNQDIYTWQASQILGRTVTKDDDEDRQKWGKVPILACGYQGAIGAIKAFAPDLDDDTCWKVVQGYRDANRAVVDFWYEAERCAIEAVIRGPRRAAVEMSNGKIKFKVLGAFLHCRLPSGRLLSYFRPRIEMDEERGKPKLVFTGYATYKPGLWTTCSTYGGKLTENIVQALCRDLMAEGMLRLEAAGYPIVLTVHDEVVSEIDKDFGDVKEFERILTIVPEWAEGFPLVAEGWRRERYGK